MRPAFASGGRAHPAPSIASRSHGFTLVEILLALVLLGLLMAGAFSGIRTATRSVERGEALIERTNKIRVAQEFLRRQIAHAMALPYENKRPTGEPIVFSASNDEMTFVAPMPGYLGHGGAYVQKLAEGSNFAHDARHVAPHSAAGAVDSCALAGNADVLARKPARYHVNNSSPHRSVKRENVIPYRECRENSVVLPLHKNACCKLISLDSANRSPSEDNPCE